MLAIKPADRRALRNLATVHQVRWRWWWNLFPSLARRAINRAISQRVYGNPFRLDR